MQMYYSNVFIKVLNNIKNNVVHKKQRALNHAFGYINYITTE